MQGMPVGDIAPSLTLIIGAALILLVALFVPRKKQWLCAILALITVGVATFFTLKLQITTPTKLSFSGTWALDDLTAWSTYAILGTTSLVILLSPVWFSSDRRHGEWYVILLFGALGAILLAGAADLMELMVAMLLSSVTGYTLASYHRANKMCAEAGAKYYFLGALANPMMFMGIVLLYALVADTSYAVLAAGFRDSSADPLISAAGFGLLLIGLTFKIGAVPGHPWVPDVAQGSPAPAAAFLTVAPKIGALVALFRIFWLIPEELLSWRWVVAILAALTMSLGNLAALRQDDVRRLLGWSSVSQVGYGLMAVVAVGNLGNMESIGSLHPAGLAGSALVMFIFAYALGNLAAFGVVVSLRGRTKLQDYQGLSQRRPWHAAIMTLALLSLVGIPPLVGFVAKLALFGAAIQAGFSWLALLAVLNTVISLYYYLRVIGAMYLGSSKTPVALLDRSSLVAFGTAGVLLIALGLAAQLIFGGDLSIVTASK